ncbi:Uncharacterised protein [Vibrio cholerae]|nr:Uncharacterised protein [Vibrio cholerae]
MAKICAALKTRTAKLYSSKWSISPKEISKVWSSISGLNRVPSNLSIKSLTSNCLNLGAGLSARASTSMM